MFKDYQSKPVTRRAYQIEEGDVITKEEGESSFSIIVAGKTKDDRVFFKAHEQVKVGDYIVYLTDSDIYHCFAVVFAERNVLDSQTPVSETKQLRVDLDVVLQRLKTSNRCSHERDISIRKIQEAIMWLGMDLKAQNEVNPYPDSYKPGNQNIAPTADGLKL